MEYKMDFRVRYTEIGADGCIPLHQYLDYFQDLATFHSEDLGYGYEKLLKEEHGWFLLAYDINVSRYPKMGEWISIITEPYKFRGFYGYRKFRVLDGEGKQIADADSLWIHMDLAKLLPDKIPDEMAKTYTPVPSKEKPRVKRKLSEEGEWEARTTIDIKDIYLDTNGHVNNRFYCIWAEKYLEDGNRASKIRIDYRKSSFVNDELSVYSFHDGEALHVKFINQNDELVAIVELTN